jgi:aminopeptidase N
MHRICCVVLMVLTVAASAAAQRLPTTVVPDHYDLTFTIDLAHARFDGRTGIDVRLTQPTDRIKLHALELDITSATVSAGGQSQKASVAMNADEQTVTLTVTKPLPAGTARIDIEYGAALNDKLRGLYLSKGRNRSYAVTQFESTDARRAFPGFDEPAFKATFDLTVVADRGDTAISNGRIVTDTPGPGAAQHTMKFSTTAKMSPYLLAIAVGDFQCLEGGADDVPIRICTTPDKKALAHLALEFAQENLKFLNQYHTIKYPFGKLDIVAVPDFAAGAIENTAAIFYREADLLADSKTASPATKQTIAGILAHEMAHQWFGDLVTMQWWDDLWLNESFATWMGTRPLAAHREWHMDVAEARETQTAFGLDSLAATRPIHTTVNTPEEIESVFDPIAYEKGASVLRMIEAYIGEDAFRKGVNAYIEKHKYGNATAEDFFAALTNASGKPVDRVMGTFVMQPGVPQVEVSARCGNGRTEVTIAQRRFTLDAAGAGASRERWQLPVCLKAAGQAGASCSVVTEPTQTLSIGASCAPWVFANAGGKGYYRTVYEPALLKALAPDVETALTPAERLALVSDEWALIRTGRHSVADYLALASGFAREPLADVLGVVTQRLGEIDEDIVSERARPQFRAFVQTLFQPALQAIGFERAAADSEDRRSLRNVLVGALGLIAEDPDVVAKARQTVTDSLQTTAGGAALDPILAGTLVTIAAENGDARLFDALMREAAAATDPQIHYRYLFALTAFKNPALIQRALDYAVSPDLRSQDTTLYLGAFFRNAAARDKVWSFVKANWSQLGPKIMIAGGDTNLAASLANFCTAEARDDIQSFFATHKMPTAARTLRQTIERINSCIATKEKQRPALDSWLASR